MQISMGKMIDDDNPSVLEVRMTDLLLENKARASFNFHNFYRHVCRTDGKESDFFGVWNVLLSDIPLTATSASLEVTIAKLHSSLGGCLHDMGRFSEAAEQYGEAGMI